MVITDHAYKMAKKRLKWKRNVIDKMAAKAFEEGILHSQTKGKLKRYIDKLYLSHRTANNIRIYGEDVYFFAGDTLITLYRLPSSMLKYLSHSD